jgi:hypothetical protein
VDPRAVRGRPGRRFGRRDAEHPALELDLGELVGLASVDSAGAQCPQYLETAPTDSPRARLRARTLKLLDCSPISCFKFDLEILSFGITALLKGQNPQGYAVYLSINLQPPTSLSTIVNIFPPP